MISTAFLDQWGSKAFCKADLILWYRQNLILEYILKKPKEPSETKVKEIIGSWIFWGLEKHIIVPCKVKGSRKKYYKTVQPPF